MKGTNNAQGLDIVQFEMQLQAPNDVNCAAIDFAFYTEEYPEFRSTLYNDEFSAELNGSSFATIGNQPISVENNLGISSDTGTTYDGGTALYTAQTPIQPGQINKLVFTIQDRGDPIYDSAVLLDNFRWSSNAECISGAAPPTAIEPEDEPTFNERLYLPIIEG